MRFLRSLALITIFAACAFGQTPDPIQILLGEVQQLRLAIERSTLLGARTQIALQRIQIQEARTRQLEQEASSLRARADQFTFDRTQLEAHLKEAEERLPRAVDPKEQQALEHDVRASNQELASMGTIEQQVRAREAAV